MLAEGAAVLRGIALSREAALLAAIAEVTAAAPLRHLLTPGGQRMSAAMSNCGAAGWVSDRRGYRYQAEDPDTGRPWPRLPAVFADLAAEVAAKAGYAGFTPDVCLINRYRPGDRMGLHQDRDERDFTAPIVSISLGLTATFLFGGMTRSSPTRRVDLRHGDAVVWGGPSRLAFHGIQPVAEGVHPLTGRQRFNLTFRRAL